MVSGTLTSGSSSGLPDTKPGNPFRPFRLGKDLHLPPDITDYGNSYVRWTGIRRTDDTRKPGHMPGDNTVRILLDSRCWITDASGETREYNMISPCRTEWMYRTDTLWQQPNYEFTGIYSATEWMAGHVRAGDVQEFGGDWRVERNIG